MGEAIPPPSTTKSGGEDDAVSVVFSIRVLTRQVPHNVSVFLLGNVVELGAWNVDKAGTSERRYMGVRFVVSSEE